jgi:uncharacterized protein YggE
MYINQSIDRPIGINVYGSDVLRAEPDRAEVDLAVVRIAPVASTAFAETRKAVDAVRQALRKAGIPDTDVEAGRVELTTAYEGFGPAAKFLGYRSSVAFRFVVRKLDGIEQTLSNAVDAGANQVQRVRYQTTKLRDLRAEARQHAVEAARRKAEIYCEAAGVRLGHVIHIEDVNPDRVMGLYRGSAHSETPSPEEDEESVPSGLQPGSLVVEAAVMLTYALLHE